MTTTLVTAINLARTFLIGSEEVHAVHDVDLEIVSGKLMAITWLFLYLLHEFVSYSL